jgi:hypothetical protein
MEYFKRLSNELSMTGCSNFSEQTVTDLPEAERLIFNDGQTTYLVHSTVPGLAEKIFESGFNFRSIGNQPALWVTTHMLEGPEGQGPQDLINKMLLDCQYRKGGIYRPFTAKVVMSFPFSRPSGMSPDGTERHPQANSDLGRPSEYVEVWGPDKDRFRIPARFIEGYIDQEAHTFVPNPNFVPFSGPEQAATTAVGGLHRAVGTHRAAEGRHRREP